jgi:rhodanese-related sulfurtransferase
MAGTIPPEIGVADLLKLKEQGAPLAILDVREPWELEICRIDGSIDVPLQAIPGRIGELPHDRPLAVICHHGGRSAHATAWLRQNGFDNATNVRGGIDAWAREIDPSMQVY